MSLCYWLCFTTHAGAPAVCASSHDSSPQTQVPPEPHEELRTMWSEVQDQLQGPLEPSETLKHQNSVQMQSLSGTLGLPLLRLKAAPPAIPNPELSITSMLAEGGMGRVYAAHQNALQREVAIKAVIPERESPKATWNLLQESWVTGQLEHPNIIPVHLLGEDEEGRPLLVMKKIEGVLWGSLVRGGLRLPDFVEDRSKPLVWHLQILLQVCRAIEYAHNKGILHRDMKPSNVMIGSFGEVYVLDWGIAVQIDPDQDNKRLPHAKRSKGLVGTPSYMAPEMTTGDGADLSRATDIYLLGAVLHELITGYPPHRGVDIREILYKAFCSVPHDYGSRVPRELAAICHKALHVSPQQRHPAVKDFRLAIQRFLQHLESHELTHNASLKLDTLLAMFQTRSKDTADDTSYTEEQRYALFGRCHFSYQRALEIWPQNQEASHALQRLLEGIIRHEVARENDQAAARWIAELPLPNQALENQLEDLRLRKAQERERVMELQRLAYEGDISLSADVRRRAALALFAVWGFICLGSYIIIKTGLFYPDNASMLGVNLAFGVFLGITVYAGRRQLLGNKANRQMVLLFTLLFCTLIFNRLGNIVLQTNLESSIQLEFTLFFLFVGTISILYNRKILIAAFLYVLLFFLTAWTPTRFFFFFITLAHPLCLGIVAWYWTNESLQQAEEENFPPPPEKTELSPPPSTR